MGVSHTLKDIRPKAEEKARRKAEGLQQGAPPGDGFMSERTRAKEALREEVNTYTGENVRKIAATTAAAEEDRILRVTLVGPERIFRPRHRHRVESLSRARL